MLPSQQVTDRNLPTVRPSVESGEIYLKRERSPTTQLVQQNQNAYRNKVTNRSQQVIYAANDNFQGGFDPYVASTLGPYPVSSTRKIKKK